MDRVRIGLIGAGVMGRIHARSLSHAPWTAQSLVAVADLDHGKASRCAEEVRCEGRLRSATTSCSSDPSIDAVVICTPGTTHAAIIEAAANAGNHIFCEKPIDWDLAAVDRALAAVERCGRQAPDRLPAALRRRVPASAGGHHLRSGRASAYPAPDQPRSREPLHARRAEGDLYFDSTIHDLDMVRFLTGEEVESVMSFGGGDGSRRRG